MSYKSKGTAITLSMLFWVIATPASAAPQTIRPGEIWPDDRGMHVQAHGGGIIKLDDTYYWFGEDRSQGLDRAFRYVACYSSKDLAHWTFRKRIQFSPPEEVGTRGWVLERPKVYYNAKTKKYVMYVHLDDGRYALARVGVATCDTVDGDYRFLKSFRPLGCESRDIGQFIDDDGSAYLIFEDRPAKGFHIARLSEDYLNVEKDVFLIRAPLEGGAVVHYQGLYYAIGSALTGWNPNPNKYATAKSLEGPWSEFKDIAPPETKTYGSQSTLMLKVVGAQATTVIFMADQWRPRTQWDSRYLWMPLEIGDGNLWLPEPKEWTLDVETGQAVIQAGQGQGNNALLPRTSATVLSVDLAQPGRPISPDLFGAFFEDLNYAADGGLYAELVQNRSFEYQATERLDWTPMTAWERVTRDGGRGSLKISDAVPVHPNNPHYVVVETQQPGGGVGLSNSGFDGIPVQAGESYDLSMFARQLFTGNHWGGTGVLEGPARLVVRLEGKEQTVLGEASLEVSGRDWQRVAATLTPSATDPSAKLTVLSLTRGAVALDEISLFPHKTFKGRPNGLRADLAETIADLRPRFVRFPGGCLVHGHGLGNMYRWKDSIGPIEQRRGQSNLWGYHQSLGLGYFEFFQFCEDIGAKPLPVVPAGVCCQNADDQGGTGQRGLPLEAMPAYIQEVLDLIEWANGPADSQWGSKRAAAGHTEPFGLQYLGVGNEEHITPVFKERFKMIHDAVKARHPEIIVIGTVGPFHSGEDYEQGWKIANELQLAMVDEHYYEKPEWFLNNLVRYDRYDRARSKVYLGEYAAHETNRANTLRSALAEAAYLTSLERNGDVVRLASYAPLLGRQGHTQWRPDMIYFDHARILLTANYYVQQMFGRNSGDTYLSTTITPPTQDANPLTVSCVRDSRSGDVILKAVNTGSFPRPLHVELKGAKGVTTKAVKTELKADPSVVNTFENPTLVAPQTSTMTMGDSFDWESPAHSLTVIRFNGPVERKDGK